MDRKIGKSVGEDENPKFPPDSHSNLWEVALLDCECLGKCEGYSKCSSNIVNSLQFSQWNGNIALNM
jgi:hypothetical protein